MSTDPVRSQRGNERLCEETWVTLRRYGQSGSVRYGPERRQQCAAMGINATPVHDIIFVLTMGSASVRFPA